MKERDMKEVEEMDRGKVVERKENEKNGKVGGREGMG